MVICSIPSEYFYVKNIIAKLYCGGKVCPVGTGCALPGSPATVVASLLRAAPRAAVASSSACFAGDMEGGTFMGRKIATPGMEGADFM
jgi:hypothetical protein